MKLYQEKSFDFKSHMNFNIFLGLTMALGYGAIIYLEIDEPAIYWILHACTALCIFMILGFYIEQLRMHKFKYCDEGILDTKTQELWKWSEIVWYKIAYEKSLFSCFKIKFIDRLKPIELGGIDGLERINDLILAHEKAPLPDENNTISWDSPLDFMSAKTRNFKKKYLNMTSLLTFSFILILITILLFIGVYFLVPYLPNEPKNLSTRIGMSVGIILCLYFFVSIIAILVLGVSGYDKNIITPQGICLMSQGNEQKTIRWQNISEIQIKKTEQFSPVIEVKCRNEEFFDFGINTEQVNPSEVMALINEYRHDKPKEKEYAEFDQTQDVIPISEVPEKLTPCTLSKAAKRSPWVIILTAIFLTVLLGISFMIKDNSFQPPQTLARWISLIIVITLVPGAFCSISLFNNISKIRKSKKISFSNNGIYEAGDNEMYSWDELVSFNKINYDQFCLVFPDEKQFLISNFMEEKELIYQLASKYADKPVVNNMQKINYTTSENPVPGTIAWVPPIDYAIKKLPGLFKETFTLVFKYCFKPSALFLVFILEILFYLFALAMNHFEPEKTVWFVEMRIHFVVGGLMLVNLAFMVLIAVMSIFTRPTITLLKNAVVINKERVETKIEYARIEYCRIHEEGKFQMLTLKIIGEKKSAKFALPDEPLYSKILEKINSSPIAIK